MNEETKQFFDKWHEQGFPVYNNDGSFKPSFVVVRETPDGFLLRDLRYGQDSLTHEYFTVTIEEMLANMALNAGCAAIMAATEGKPFPTFWQESANG